MTDYSFAIYPLWMIGEYQEPDNMYENVVCLLYIYELLYTHKLYIIIIKL